MYLPLQNNKYKVPKGTPKKVIFVNKDFTEKPGGKVRPCPREACEAGHFWKEMFLKMTDNLVFAGQPIRTATLPEHGQGA